MASLEASHRSYRRRLPDERAGIAHKFSVAGHEGYIHVGLFSDGTPGEIFINISKQGSTVAGLCDTIAILFSMCLQYNVPIEVLVSKLEHMTFEPAGFTGNPDLPRAASIADYVAKWLRLKFLPHTLDTPNAGERPFAQAEPAPKPENEDIEPRHSKKIGRTPDKVEIIRPPEPQAPATNESVEIDLSDPVLAQAVKIGSQLTAPADPTKKSEP
jgi:hypothetical protein